MAIDTAASARGGAWSPRRPLLMALALLLIAAGIWAAAAVPWRQAAAHVAARGWPVAEASVAAVSLSEEAGPAGSGRTLRLAAAYGYTVGGVAYAGDRVSLQDSGALDDRRLKTLFGRLRFAEVTGRTVPVAYDPADPSRAYLDTGFAWRTALLFGGLAFCALAVGLGVAAAALRAPKGQG